MDRQKIIPTFITKNSMFISFSDNGRDNEKVGITFGRIFLRFMSPFYVCCCFNQITSGALRGLGDSKGPMVIMLGSFVVFRQLYLAVTAMIFGNVYAVAFAYPAGWIVCSLGMGIYYHITQVRHVHWHSS